MRHGRPAGRSNPQCSSGRQVPKLFRENSTTPESSSGSRLKRPSTSVSRRTQRQRRPRRRLLRHVSGTFTGDARRLPRRWRWREVARSSGTGQQRWPSQETSAGLQFQTLLNNRGLWLNAPGVALAHLGLGRAWALAGDMAKARRAYQDFLALWKDADPDIPILKEAKAEYAKLK